jgi:integrase
MASFRKRGSSGWQAQVRRKGYPAQSKSFSTRAAAVQWVRSIEYEMDQGLFVSRNEAETTTVGELLNRYLIEYTPHKKGAGPEACRIRALLRHPIANRFIGTVRGVDMARYRDERLKKVTGGSIRRELTILSHLFEVSRKEWGIFVHNPVRDIKLPPNNRARNRRLQDAENASDTEETRLFTACRRCRNPYLLPIVRFALETAMRQSEIVRLHWQHVNIKRRTAFLPDTKNGDSRTVPLSGIAVDVLTALPRSISGEVFPGVTTQSIKKAFIRATHRAGIEDLHFHDLRHEATTRLFEQGLNIMEVSSITGHRDLQMLRRYTHLRAEDLAKKLL